MKTVAIILARGGSKGIPGKNLRHLNGRALMDYAIGHANESDLVDRVIVSTDSERIAHYAKSHGAETPFLRPAHLSSDTSTMHSGLKHAVDWLQANENYKVDIVVLLKATIIFRPVGIIDECVQRLYVNPQLDTAVAGHGTVKKFWRLVDGKWTQLADDIDPGLGRQERASSLIYKEDHGVACASRSEVVLNTNHYVGTNVEIVPYEDERSFFDIDGYFDLWLADKIIKEWNPIRMLPPQMQDEALHGGLD